MIALSLATLLAGCGGMHLLKWRLSIGAHQAKDAGLALRRDLFQVFDLNSWTGMKECEERLWREMLNSELTSEFFAVLASHYARWDKRTKIVLAVASSGTVAGWGIFNDATKYPYSATLWHAASGVATLVAIALPILNFPKKAEWAIALRIGYQSAAKDYEDVWLRRASLTDSELLDETQKVMDKEKALSGTEAHFPERDERLLKKCQKTILRRRELTQ